MATKRTEKLSESTPREPDVVLAALGRLQSLEQNVVERLTRVEENLYLLRGDLMGNGQPGRLRRLEMDLDQLRAESQRQRGLLAGVSLIVSTAVAVLAQFLFP